jgi:hypothetical protein
MTESDILMCKAGSITICPIDKTVLDAQTLTCESELYFQKTTNGRSCQRKLIVHYVTPTLVQYVSRGTYHFPTRSRMIMYPQGSMWGVETQNLEGVGFIGNATDCDLTTN